MSRRAWALFVAMSLIWGIPYLLIKIAVQELPPVTVVFGRILVGALLLLPLALSRGALRGLRARFGWVVGLALLEIAVPMPLISAGEQRIASSLTGLLISVEPVVVALLALRFDHAERVNGTRLAGLVIGMGGVAALLGFDAAATPSQLLGAGMVLAATASYAGGVVLLKRKLADLDSLGVSALTLVIAALLLAPAAWEGLPSRPPGADALAAVVVLGVVCTAAGFLLYFQLIADAGPSRATVITYVNPAVAVALGVAVLGEPVTTATVAGFLLIIAGSWLSTGGRPPGVPSRTGRRRRPAPGPIEPAPDPGRRSTRVDLP